MYRTLFKQFRNRDIPVSPRCHYGLHLWIRLTKAYNFLCLARCAGSFANSTFCRPCKGDWEPKNNKPSLFGALRELIYWDFAFSVACPSRDNFLYRQFLRQTQKSEILLSLSLLKPNVFVFLEIRVRSSFIKLDFTPLEVKSVCYLSVTS